MTMSDSFRPCSGPHGVVGNCPTPDACTAARWCQRATTTGVPMHYELSPLATYTVATVPEKQIVFARSGDWEQMYVNGETVARGHSLRPGEVLEALGISYREIDYSEDEVENGTAFPDRITESDIQKRERKRGQPR